MTIKQRLTRIEAQLTPALVRKPLELREWSELYEAHVKGHGPLPPDPERPPAFDAKAWEARLCCIRWTTNYLVGKIGIDEKLPGMSDEDLAEFSDGWRQHAAVS